MTLEYVAVCTFVEPIELYFSMAFAYRAIPGMKVG